MLTSHLDLSTDVSTLDVIISNFNKVIIKSMSFSKSINSLSGRGSKHGPSEGTRGGCVGFGEN